ncbi:conserved Plasmodium protein, unknown function [Plasmodium malariae]|uniref:Uncharacterized protein n=1 Tax=Plasmodium malariae TaxID=5858 RepID=A0A1A8VR07_PLAMA|nr:conserved Plasmodium protein, unknown function [Plasmodium malariae]
MQKNISENGNQNDLMKENKPDGKSNDLNDDNMYIFDEPDDELEEFEEMGIHFYSHNMHTCVRTTCPRVIMYMFICPLIHVSCADAVNIPK